MTSKSEGPGGQAPGGLCVFLVARHGVSQHRHVTGTFPAGNKTNVKSLEIKLVKPQCSVRLSVSWGGQGARAMRPKFLGWGWQAGRGPASALRTPGPGHPLSWGAALGTVGCWAASPASTR